MYDKTVAVDPIAVTIGVILSMQKTNIWEIIKDIPELHKWFIQYSSKQAEKLPEHQEFDHCIELTEDPNPWHIIYKLSLVEMEVLKEYIQRILKEEKIWPLSSSSGSPILFIPQPNRCGLWLCINYQQINKITVKGCTPLCLIDKLLELMAEATNIFKLNTKNGFNLVCLWEEDKWKAALETKYGLYEYLVLPFGLCNPLATFQCMMNTIFLDLLNKEIAVFIDNILVYTHGSKEEHTKLLEKVFERYKKHGIALEIDKCELYQQEVKFLRCMVSRKGIQVVDNTTEAINKYAEPESKEEFQSFIRFANFYQQFIRNFWHCSTHYLPNLKKYTIPLG